MKNSINNVDGNSLQKIAKIAGISYLLIVIIPMISWIIIDPVITDGEDIKATINNIIAHEVLFRVDTTITILMFVGVVVLALALYEILKTVNKQLAKLSLLWRFAEALVGLLATLSSIILLTLITGDNSLTKFGTEQFYALSELLLGLYWDVTPVIFILLAGGSIIVFFLFLKSRLIPKAISIWGIISYSLVLAGALISLIFSGNAFLILGSQTILFEMLIGFWLLIKGLKTSNN